MKLNHLLAIVPLLFLSACKKKDNEPVFPKYDLIVEGGISTYSKQQYIRLSKPTIFANETGPPVLIPINNAVVTVNDSENEVRFTEISNTGIYTAKVENNKNYEETYTLKVLYNSKEYTASDVLTPTLPIGTNYLPLTTKTTPSGVRLTIPKHTFGASAAHQWLILPDGKLWNPGNFKENYPYSYSHVYGTPNALNPLIEQSRIIDLSLNDQLSIYKYSLSDQYSTYLYTLFQETDWRGLLSSTPGNVKGNVSGNANGYFYAIDVEFQKRAVKDLVGN